ncbi:MAG: hypothetical protein ACYST5_04525 [Planctomycetota bacterium]|jgi:uncharacterized membrane protein
MTGKYFNFSEVLGYGWSVMKANFWFFVGLGFVFLIVTYIPTVIDMLVRLLYLPRPVFVLLKITTAILGWVINVVLGIGLIKIALSFCDERKPAIGTLFDAWDCFWRYVGAAILYALIILGGFILLIIPGIIWSVKYSLCFYFVIDKGLGPVQAIKASGRTTMGAKWELFGFFILCSLINLLGLLCLIVGIFATYPTVIVANALVYRQLLAQTPELAEFGIATPSVEPAPEPQPNEQEF